jgi:hypothetical protein
MPDWQLRRAVFGRGHPGVLIERNEFGAWQAPIPEPSGETVVTAKCCWNCPTSSRKSSRTAQRQQLRCGSGVGGHAQFPLRASSSTPVLPDAARLSTTAGALGENGPPLDLRETLGTSRLPWPPGQMYCLLQTSGSEEKRG